MARYARVVVPGIPYHVTHRGHRREPVFFSDEQRETYRRWLAQGLSDEEVSEIQRNTRTGRPCGNESFVDRLEGLLRRLLRPLKRGQKKRRELNNLSLQSPFNPFNRTPP